MKNVQKARLDGKRRVRSVENEEYGIWGVWKMRSVENAECVEMHKRWQIYSFQSILTHLFNVKKA